MLSKIQDAVKDMKQGRPVILVDDENPGNGGYLVMASELVTKENLNKMMKYGTGFTYISLSAGKIESLRLIEAFRQGNSISSMAYIAALDYVGVENGITADGRTLTVQKLLLEGEDASNFRIPGHVLVLKAENGGVLKRAGYAEAASDLALMAGFMPSGIISAVLNEQGAAANLDELMTLAKKENFLVISIEDLIAYRRETECYVERAADANLPTAYGDFRMVGFVNKLNGEHHVALVKGHIVEGDVVLVRVHSECLTGDAFHSLKCDCGEQLAAALSAIEKEGKGILLYLRQEGRGIGLINKIKAYKLQEQGLDTEEANLALGFPSDMRDYGIGAQILSELKANKLKLMTNNPKKLVGLKGHGIEVVERVPLIMDTNLHNERYFKTKAEKMGHMY